MNRTVNFCVLIGVLAGASALASCGTNAVSSERPRGITQETEQRAFDKAMENKRAEAARKEAEAIAKGWKTK
ncbi:hypothetical protein [Rhizobium phage RHEph16]|uniref:Lipoprotein n=1 Tax=Rhizobium phage RHEph16 TaxID=2836132 RepID=A0AAE7VMD3_9CAUD|nr:hypothetical protein PP750_gp94 [Rhizobium phage RHEph16]QXV74397.1 hypothetical protein [Rhizobium phage RHEph16]